MEFVGSFFLVNLKYGISMFLLVISVNHTYSIFKISLWILLTRKNLLVAGSHVSRCIGHIIIGHIFESHIGYVTDYRSHIGYNLGILMQTGDIMQLRVYCNVMSSAYQV